MMDFKSIPILDLEQASDAHARSSLLQQLRQAIFDTGFLYIKNHGIPLQIIDNLPSRLPASFALDSETKRSISKLNSPAFLGYSGFAEETTQGKSDLREQFDFATESPGLWEEKASSDSTSPHMRDWSEPYWRLYGPNQFPTQRDEEFGLRESFFEYHDALDALARRFVHLVEEALGIPVGTYDSFYRDAAGLEALPHQNRVKLLSYPPNVDGTDGHGVGAHKDSSGWLTFLYQPSGSAQPALEVVNASGQWIAAPPLPGSFVVNFGNAFEAATDGAVRATIHRVRATSAGQPTRYSIAFFQGLPLDMTVSEIRAYMPPAIRALRRQHLVAADDAQAVSTFLDPRWDRLGESQLRKWMRSHADVARKWYAPEQVAHYLA